MRRIISLLIVLVLCLSLAAPAFATENGFVPSITYKPEPEIIPVKDEKGEDAIGVIRNEDGEVVDYVYHGCFRITPIAHVWDEEIEVPDYIEELLIYVYEGLNDGSLPIDYEKFNANLNPADMVIRDLFDIRWYCDEHRALLEQKGNTLDIIFDLGVVSEAQIFVASFDENTKDWTPIVKTVNNGDGTVTCTFDHFCAMSFSMPLAGTTVPVDDAEPAFPWIWIIILVLAVVTFVVIVVIKNKKKA